MKQLIDVLSKNKYRIIAIDGRCASGKTTLSNMLMEKLNAEVIHLDHFFLSNVQKTEQRMNEIGGNINYERFITDVLVKVGSNQPFEYLAFDCNSQSLKDKYVIDNNRLLIIEGTYAHHPKFIKYYDYLVFLTIDESLQIERLQKRNPQLINRFINDWIPKEEIYFETFKIKDHADIIINTNNM